MWENLGPRGRTVSGASDYAGNQLLLSAGDRDTALQNALASYAHVDSRWSREVPNSQTTWSQTRAECLSTWVIIIVIEIYWLGSTLLLYRHQLESLPIQSNQFTT